MNILQNNDARCAVGGVEYDAVTSPNGLCAGNFGKCAAFPEATTCWQFAPCGGGRRADKADVVWVKAT